MGGARRASRTTGFSSRSTTRSSFWVNILMPVTTRMAPKTYTIQLNRSSRRAPSAIMISRITIAPRMPHLRTLGWASGRTPKYEKISRKTKRLSTLSDSSIR